MKYSRKSKIPMWVGCTFGFGNVFACSEYMIGTEVKPSTELSEELGDSAMTTLDTSDEDTETTSDEPLAHGLSEPTGTSEDGFDSGAGLSSNLGNVVTILMALSEQWIPEETAKQLLINSVDFVSDISNPSILIVRDDNTNGEDEQDPLRFTQWLTAAGYQATFLQEPTNGIQVSDLQGYHVVIFSNPGFPPDDNSTIDALYAFSRQGFGVILQGDDMTQTENPNMQAMTRLLPVDNGGTYYGTAIDNNEGAAYSVRLVPYNVLNTAIQLSTFPYGNDIDTATLASSSLYVAAWATVEGSNFPEKPVITAYAPSQSVFE